MFKFSGLNQEKDISLFALSPDNRLIAYGFNTSGNGDIYITPTSGWQPVQVTDHPATDAWPTWSFDGRWLAFLSGRSGENEIWAVKISAEGRPEGEPFQVSQGGTGRNSSFSWTKDGKIGISKTPAVSNIYIADLNSGKQIQVTKMLTNDQSPRWSPDGAQIAYISEKAGQRDLWLISPGGGEPRLITGSFSARQGVQSISSPCWLPDGKSIAFTVFIGDRGSRGIWVIPAQGGEARKINFTCEGSLRRMAWSPDGKKIAFDYLGVKDDKTIKGSRTFAFDVYVIPAEGGEPARITKIEKQGLIFQFPRWSPDGKKIAFWSQDMFESNQGKEAAQIWIADLERGKAEPITKKISYAWQALCWAPDGKSILFSIMENNKDQLFSVPSTGGELTKLNIEGTFAEYSPDGKRIAFAKRSKTIHEFWLVENFRPGEANSRRK
jgi:Tol biopolymer transport system component